MTHEEICNILMKKKLSGLEKLDLVKESILRNPDIINTLINRKTFEYSNVVGLSLLYVPEVFNFINENALPVDYSVISKNNESLLHIITRSKYQWEFIDNVLPNTLEYINTKDIDGYSPLLNSIKYFLKNNNKEKNTNIINLLLKKGAKTNFSNDLENPLYMAVSSHDYEVIDILLNHGMNINTLINGKPLALYVDNNDKCHDYFKMVNFLISRRYDYKIFNKKNEWKIDLLNKSSVNNNDLIPVSNTFMKEGINFEFDFKEILTLFCKLKQNLYYIDIIKLFENLNIDYTQTQDKKNVLSFTCNSWIDQKNSQSLFYYLIKKDVKIDLDINVLFFNSDHTTDINKAITGRHFIEKALNILRGQELIDVLSFVEKNITVEQGNKIPISFDYLLPGMEENKLKNNELSEIFNKLFDKVYATKWSGIKSKEYLGTPLVDTFIAHNVYLREVHMEYLLETLLSQIYYKTFCASIPQLVSEKTGEYYEDSLLKKYMQIYPECFNNKNIKEWVGKQTLLGTLRENNEDHNYLKASVVAVIEQDILKNSLSNSLPVNVQKRRI
jgi:hypothetical protein